MVEVWLPFGETKIPILLPEPVRVNEIKGRSVVEETSEAILEKISRLKKGEEELEVIFNPDATPTEKLVFEKIFRSCNIAWSEKKIVGEEETYFKRTSDGVELEFCEDMAAKDLVFAGVFRPSIVFGFSGCLTSFLSHLRRNSYTTLLKKSVEGGLEYGKESGFHSTLSEIADEYSFKCMSVVLDASGRVARVFAEEGSEPWRRSRDLYLEIWGTGEDLNKTIIASSGGVPWDTHFIASLSGLYNVVFRAEKRSRVIYLSEAEEGLEVDLTLLWMALRKRRFVDVSTACIYKLRRLLREKEVRSTFVSTVPKVYTEGLGVKRAERVDDLVSAIPSRFRREISLVENACGTLFI